MGWCSFVYKKKGGNRKLRVYPILRRRTGGVSLLGSGAESEMAELMTTLPFIHCLLNYNYNTYIYNYKYKEAA